MRFAAPWVLLLLVLVPLWWWWHRQLARRGGVLFSSVAVAQGATSIWARFGPGLLLGLRALALVLVILALARPQLGRGETKLRTEGIDIVLAVDVSGSMQALDFKLEGKQADRLSVVKKVVREFIQARPDDRLGMVAFAGRAYIASPLTLDHDWLLLNLERVRIGLIEDGTAIGAAIGSAANRLRDSQAKSKVVILLTDGVNNVNRVPPLEATKAAQQFGVRIYTIGAGTRGVAPMPVYMAGRLVGYQPTPVEIDEALLTQIAQQTGGQYFRATDTDSLRQIYEQIDKLEKRAVETVKFEEWRELFGWLVLPALGLLLAGTLLEHTRLRRLP